MHVILKPLVVLCLPTCLCLCWSGCGSDRIDEADFSKIKAGMTQQEVEELFGKPNSVKTEGDETLLNYRTSDGLQDVILKNGKVTGTAGRTQL